MPVSPHRSEHLWMLINTPKLQNSEDCRTLDFLFINIIFFISLYFIILWQENLKKHALFQLPMGEYVLAWDGIMALGLRTKSGMGIQTAHVLVSYGASGLRVAGKEQLRQGQRLSPSIQCGCGANCKKQMGEAEVRTFSKKKQRNSIFRSRKCTCCSTAQIMSG